MDIIGILILMAVLYIVPEILDRKHPKKYEYPLPPIEQPETKGDDASGYSWHERDKQQVQQSVRCHVGNAVQTEEQQPASVPQVDVAAHLSVSTYEQQAAALRQRDIVNGFIMAQILARPKAYQHCCRNFRRQER